MTKPNHLWLLLLAVLLCACGPANGLNGFDLRASLIPVARIESGGPGRDGIPAIDRPRFVAAAQADFLDAEDRVLGLHLNGAARAYPIAILNWHEIVNDRIDTQAAVVSYCPLCGSGMAFAVDGDQADFGVSGLLYNSDVLLYDRKTESLWSQIMAQAVSGPRRGERLRSLAISHTSWADWRQRHPDTLVLSTDTGHRRDYGRDPYAGYRDNPAIWFQVSHRDDRYPSKELVLGLALDGDFRAYPFSELAQAPAGWVDRFRGRALHIRFDRQHQTAWVEDPDGNELPSLISFWFAWVAFHPETEVFTAPVAEAE